MELSKEAGVLGRPRASADYNFSEGDKTDRRVEGSWIQLTNVRLSEETWLEEASTMHDWVVWCNSKKGAEEIRPFELSGKEIFSNYD